MALLPVDTAREKILKNVKPLPAESIPLEQALHRVLTQPVKARCAQPPFNASAMDGYAVRASDLSTTPVSLEVIGTSAAGHRFKGAVRSGEAVRIFTGAPVPADTDTVIIQENVAVQSKPYISVLESSAEGRHIRPTGLDFQRGDILIPARTCLNARDIGVAAAANVANVRVRRKPVVAILSTGDELVPPGEKPRADQIISSNNFALAALITQLGAEVVNLGIVPDRLKATERAITRASDCDILITTGGASVGDHDFVKEALKNAGIRIAFWRIAMRPGKPFMYGRRKGQHVMGLPGNPVSALVCARLFLKPLIDAMLGLPPVDGLVEARLGSPLKANDIRQDYLRATLEVAPDGRRTVFPFSRQDSSMQRTMRDSQALIVRPPHAEAAKAGDTVKILVLDF
ncbi:MAG TPA: molybdopterin molybdotransferase MoeA [Aestuariivirga sp.]|nr:molybdopterin molybdotransferase MoeA [Aestuariivirga sp.]